MHIKGTVNIQIIRGLLKCYSIAKNTFKNFYLIIFMVQNENIMNEKIKNFIHSLLKIPLISKNLLILKCLKWCMTLKQNITKGNRVSKGEAKWTNK